MRHLVSTIAAVIAVGAVEAADAAVFPARTPAEVVELARLVQTTGKAGWTVWRGGERDVVEIAQRGARGLFYTEIGPGRIWAGWSRNGVEFVCASDPSTPLGCLSKKLPGVAELGTFALVAGAPFSFAAFYDVAFGPRVLARARVVQDRELGEPVSCLVARVADRQRRLCATSYGFPTRIVVGKRFRAVAYELSREVSDADLAPLAPPIEEEPEPLPQPSSSSARIPAA